MKYTYRTIQKENVKFNSVSGKSIEINIALQQEQADLFGVGEFKDTKSPASLTVTINVDGKEVFFGSTEIKAISGRNDGIIASFGPVGLTAQQKEMVQAALVKVTPKQEKYVFPAFQKSNGTCPKCGEHCYGDCQA